MHAPEEGRLLAACSVCTVERCEGCDVIHLHFGATTVRFKPAAFTLLCETLLSALGQVAPQLEVTARVRHGKATANH
jgi:hypothetical protein